MFPPKPVVSSEIAELMAVKAKHSAGGEYSPDWRPKVIAPIPIPNPPGFSLPHSDYQSNPNANQTDLSPTSSSSQRSSCLLPRGPLRPPSWKSPPCQKGPPPQPGAPCTNAPSPAPGGRARPQQQPLRLHLPLRRLPSRRRGRNCPRGHSGDVSTH